jgi:hypothetical protein
LAVCVQNFYDVANRHDDYFIDELAKQNIYRTFPFSRSEDLFSGSLLELRRWATDPAPLQANIYFDTIGDLDERDTAGHAIVLAVKGHDAVETNR